MKPARLALLALLCSLLGNAGAAGPVYRCGPDGRVFSQTPCTGGEVVHITAAPSAQRQAEARELAEREQRVADEMGRTRRVEEAARTPGRAAPLTVRPPPKRANARAEEADSRKWYRKPQTPSSGKKQRKAADTARD